MVVRELFCIFKGLWVVLWEVEWILEGIIDLLVLVVILVFKVEGCIDFWEFVLLICVVRGGVFVVIGIFVVEEGVGVGVVVCIVVVIFECGGVGVGMDISCINLWGIFCFGLRRGWFICSLDGIC